MAKQKTLTDYPQEFHIAWDLAKKQTLRLTFETKGAAVNLRQRLYVFRKLLATTLGAEEGSLLYNVDLSVSQAPDGLWLIQSYVPGWKRQLHAAIPLSPVQAHEVVASAAAAAHLPLSPEAPEAPVAQDNLSEALGGLGFKS